MRGEDRNIEYKQSWRDEYLKWICGFANASGGRMLIGVADDKKGNEVVGVADWKSLLENIPNLMRDTMGMIADVNHVRKGGKDIVEIVVPSYPVPISLRGVYYARRGATNQRLSGPGLESFLLKRRGLHWENLPCPRLKLKDISANEIKRFKDLAIDKGRLDVSVRRETKENFISHLHLVGKDGISYAGALLFTEKAERWIAGAYIKVGKFGENEADLVYRDDVHGSLIEQAEKALDLIYFKYLKAKISYEDGLHRVEKFPFPREALRELILNALVHKDYSSNIPIQISVSDDKIYIANTGSLPDDWTVKQLLGKHSSCPRNPTIAGCVYLTGMIETWGRGIRKAIAEFKRGGCDVDRLDPLARKVKDKTSAWIRRMHPEYVQYFYYQYCEWCRDAMIDQAQSAEQKARLQLAWKKLLTPRVRPPWDRPLNAPHAPLAEVMRANCYEYEIKNR